MRTILAARAATIGTLFAISLLGCSGCGTKPTTAGNQDEIQRRIAEELSRKEAAPIPNPKGGPDAFSSSGGSAGTALLDGDESKK